VTDAEWDHGVNRTSGTELLVRADVFGKLFLKTGDQIQIAGSPRRTVTRIASDGPQNVYKNLAVDGAAVSVADVGTAPIRIFRQ
jgi:hypothetical protein